jgi:hypothetical protein
MFSFRDMHLLSLATAMLLCLTTNRQNVANAHYSLRPVQTTAEDENNVGSEESMVLVHQERQLPKLCTEQLDDFQPFDGDDKDQREVDIDITLTLNDSSEKTQRKAIKQSRKALQKAMHHIMTTDDYDFEKHVHDRGLRLEVERHNIAVSSPWYLAPEDEEDLSFTMSFSFPSLTGELNYNCHDDITYAKEKITRALYRAFASSSSGGEERLEKAFQHKLKVTDNFTFAKLEVWVSMA